MSGLVEFLRARLDEDEAIASGAKDQMLPYRTPSTMGEEHRLRLALSLDPDRQLAEVQAKRRILERAATAVPDDDWCFSIDWFLGVLALPYASHPDYRAEWQPDTV